MACTEFGVLMSPKLMELKASISLMGELILRKNDEGSFLK